MATGARAHTDSKMKWNQIKWNETIFNMNENIGNGLEFPLCCIQYEMGSSTK